MPRKVYLIWDEEADSWTARPRVLAVVASYDAAIKYLEEHYHHNHHDPDHYWWKDMERQITSKYTRAGGKEVKNFTYFSIYEHEMEDT